jgi:hypothetical protein
MLPTHYDLAVILAVSFAFQLAALVYIASLTWLARREARRDAIEGQRLTKVAGALILQEAEKLRALVRDARTS